MTRRILRTAFAAALLASALPLGGCAVSLFSKDAAAETDSTALARLERRMDEVERRLGAR